MQTRKNGLAPRAASARQAFICKLLPQNGRRGHNLPYSNYFKCKLFKKKILFFLVNFQ